MIFLLGIEILCAISLVAVTSFLGYWMFLKKYHYWAGKSIPSEAPFPLLGTSAGMIFGKSFLGIDQELYKKYGKLFGAYSGPSPVLYVADPELLRDIFVKDFHAFSTRRVFKTNISIIDNMVTALHGDDQWRNIRNTMTPAFSSGKLKNMIPIISECATISLNNFQKMATSGEVINCKKLYGNYTLDVIANVAFGTRLDSHNDPDNPFVKHAHKFFGTELSIKSIIAFCLPRIAGLFGISFFPMDSINFFAEISNTILERRLKANEVRHDFLQLLMDSVKDGKESKEKDEDNSKKHGWKNEKSKLQSVEQIKRKPLTKDELIAQCILFFIAGYDTTATTLSMATYYLATNPELQTKVHEEVDRIWKNREVLDSEAIYEAKYIEAVIDETLRIAPPGLRLERTAVKDYELTDIGITIPKGMIVEIPVYAMHHDDDFFPEPENFKPERFFPKESSEVIPYTYLPFGCGPRNCIAMRLAHLEIKICMLHVFRYLKFSACEKTLIPMEFLKATGILQPKNVSLKASYRQFN